MEGSNETNTKLTLSLLTKRILAGSLVILFIGVCSFALLFCAMYFL